MPGSYPADETWTRPPHIHFKVSSKGYIELITQMYFAGDLLNSKDLILSRLKKSEQAKVVIELKQSGSNYPQAHFDIQIEKIR